MRFQYAVSLAVVFFTVQALCYRSECVLQTSAGSIDLNYAGSSQGAFECEDKTVIGKSPWEYYVQICGAAGAFPGSDKCQSKYPNAKAYQYSPPDSRDDCFPMAANDNTADMTLELLDKADPKGGVRLSYATVEFNGYKRTTILEISCNPSDDGSIEFRKEDYTDQNSVYHFGMQSKWACPGVAPVPGPGGNMPLGHYGVGGLLMTLMFAALVLYFIVGALINKFKFQKTGIEIIPQVNFWKDIPFLLKDGVMLIVDGIKKLTGKGNSNYTEVA